MWHKKALLNRALSRADWIRTSDPYVPNVVRYRAALHPEKKIITNNEMNTLDLVGWTGFEPATPCTPCKCATGLRHHPNWTANVHEIALKNLIYSLTQMRV